MAGNITIKADLDVSGILKSLSQVAAAEANMLRKAESSARVPQLSSQVGKKLESTSVDRQARMSATAAKEAVAAQARMVALKLQEYEVQKRISTANPNWTWKNASKSDLEYRQRLQNAAASTVQQRVGSGFQVDTSFFEREITGTLKSFASSFKGVALENLSKVFNEVMDPASQLFTDLGITKRGQTVRAETVASKRDLDSVNQAQASTDAKTKEADANRAAQAAKKEKEKAEKEAQEASISAAKEYTSGEKKRISDQKKAVAAAEAERARIDAEGKKAGAAYTKGEQDRIKSQRKIVEAQEKADKKAQKEAEKVQAANEKSAERYTSGEKSRIERQRKISDAAEKSKQDAYKKIEDNAAKRADSLETGNKDYKDTRLKAREEATRTGRQRRAEEREQHRRDNFNYERDEWGSAAGPLRRFILQVSEFGDVLAANTAEVRASMARALAAEEELINRIKAMAAKVTLDNPEMLSSRISSQADQSLLKRVIDGGAVAKIAGDDDMREQAAVAQMNKVLGDKKIKNLADAKMVMGEEFANLTLDEQILATQIALNKLQQKVDSGELSTLNGQIAALKQQEALQSSAAAARRLLSDPVTRDMAVDAGIVGRMSRESISADVSETIANSNYLTEQAASNAVRKKAAEAEIEIATRELALANDALRTTQDAKERIKLQEQANAAERRLNAAKASNNQAEIALNNQALRLNSQQQISSDPDMFKRQIAMDAEQKRLRLQRDLELQRTLDEDQEYQRLVAARDARKPRSTQLSIGQRMRQAFTSPGEFLGGGLLTTARYALPSAAMWGSWSVITEGIKDAEEFNLVLSQLEIQLKDTGAGGEEAFKRAKNEIVALSKESGIAAADLAEMRRHIQGAFGSMTEINLNDKTGSRGGLRGSDGIIRYGEDLINQQAAAAAQLSLVTGISSAELTDGLSAASFAFGASADRIGDVVTKLESVGGVYAKDLIAFIGDIAPSAQEAGFELEEMAAIATQAMKRSGMGGAAIAEQMGRIMAAMSGNSAQFFDIADANRSTLGESNYQEFIKSVQGGDTRAVFMTLGKYYQQLDKSSREAIVNMIGGQRQANTLLAAFADADGLSNYIEEAKDSFGSLEKRYDNLRKKISNTANRLKTEFNEFVRLIMDAGVVDAVNNILRGFTTVLSVIGALASPVIKLNDALGGTLSHIASIAIQVAALRASLFALNVFKGTPTGGMLLGRMGGAAQSFGFMGGASGTSRAYRRSLEMRSLGGAIGPVLGSNSDLRAGLSRSDRIGARKDAFSSLIGGKAGVGMLAGTAVLAAYGYISGIADKDKAEVQELRAELRNSDKSAAQLREAAQGVTESTSAWSRGWRSFWGIMSERTAYELEATMRDTQPKIDELVAFLNSNDGENQAKAAESIFGEINKISSDRYDKPWYLDAAAWAGIGSDAGINSEQARKDFAEFLKRMGLDETAIDIPYMFESLDPELRKAILYNEGDTKKVIAKLQNLMENTENEAMQGFLASIITAMRNRVATDPSTSSAFATAQSALSDFAKLEVEDIAASFDGIRSQFQAGAISESQYTTAVRNKVEQLRGKAREGQLSTQDKEWLTKYPSLVASDLKAFADSTFTIYDTLAKVAGPGSVSAQIAEMQRALGSNIDSAFSSALSGLGASSDTDSKIRKLSSLKGLLENSEFTDNASRMEVVLEYVQIQQELLGEAIRNASDPAEVDRLLKEGMEIPASVRAAGQASLLADDGQIKEWSQAWEAIREQAISITQAIEDGADDVNSELKNILDDAGIDIDFDISTFITEFTKELTSEAGLSAKTIKDTRTMISKLRSGLNNSKNLDEGTIRGVESQINLLIRLLNLGGVSAQRLNLFKPQTISSAFQAVSTRIANRAQGTLSGMPDRVRASAEMERQSARDAKTLRDLDFDRRRALAGDDKAAIAAIDREAARADIAWAKANLTGQEQREAIARGEIALIKANQATADAMEEVNTGRFDLLEAIAESNGDIVAAAEVGLARAKDELSRAKTAGERDSARAAIIRAQTAIREAIQQQRDAQVGLLRTLTGDDAVKQAEFDLAFAKIQESEARGILAKAEAAKATIEAQRNLNKAMFDVQQSMYDLRQAQFQAMDDEVGAAQIAAEAARAQLADAASRGAGAAEINQIKASIITADKAARDALLNSQLDEYQYLLDTGKITQTQYIQYLEGLKSTLDPASKQFKDLERTLYKLKNDIGADLQMNLPTDLTLPTLYQARRLDQSTGISAGGATVGYQDNRTMDIQITIAQNMTEDEIVTIMSNALGTGRNAITTPRRY